MDVLYIIGLICSCFVTDFVFFRIMDGLYERKYLEIKWLYALMFSGCFIVHILIAWLRLPVLNLGYSMVALWLMSFILYKIGGKNVFVNSMIVIIYLAIIDTCVTTIFSIFWDSSTYAVLMEPKSYLLSSVGNAIVVICTNSLFIQLLQRCQISRISKVLHLYMLFLMVFEFSVFLVFIENKESTSTNIDLLLLCVGFLILDAGILYLYKRISEQARHEKRSVLIEQQLEMNAKYYDDLKENYEKTQKLLHDMKKHLQTLNGLRQFDKTAQTEYEKEFKELIENTRPQFVCSDKIVCAIIWDKIQLCERNAIEFEISMQDILFDFMGKTEVTALFVNLLDNGIESCLDSNKEKKEIFLRIHNFKDYVVIKMKNTIGAPPQLKGKKFISTKSGHIGLGTSIMEEIAEKYCGNVNYDYSNEFFETKIILSSCNLSE